MGIDVDVIFKIAGVGIVVAFLHTILDQVGEKRLRQMGHTHWIYLYFIYGCVDCRWTCFKKSGRFFYFSDGGKPSLPSCK